MKCRPLNCMFHASGFPIRRRLPMMLSFGLLLCVVIQTHCAVVAEETAAASRNGNSEEEDAATERLETMLRIGAEFQFQLPDEQPPAKFHPQALLRWTNPVSTVRDGIVGVYVSEGRPVGFVEIQMHDTGRVAHEFSSISDQEVVLKRGDKPFWIPADDWSTYLRIEGAPKPSAKKTQRLVQMKMIARKFQIVDEFGLREGEITPYTLRLLPNPVYRFNFDGEGEIVDGAFFVFAQGGTDPEAVLWIEAVKQAEQSFYRCVFAPSTIFELTASADGEVIRHKPRRLVFDERKGDHFAGGYKPE